MTNEAERVKRAIDIVGAAAGLALAAPVLAVAAAAIKLEDSGPVFFRQMRLGRGEQPFEVLKLRTMTIDAEKVRSDGERYDARQRRRLEVRPGLTGWAQIHGRASLPWPERLELDVWYVENRSLALDARILARTAGALLRRDFVYRGEAGGWR